MLKKRPENRPWALLRMSRRQYEAARPWQKAKPPMTRQRFEALLPDVMSDELYELLKDQADAQALLDGIFGPNAEP